MSATEIAARVRARELRAADVAAQALDRIGRADPQLCAFIEVWGEEALRRAGEVDARLDRRGADPSLPLAGVPVAVKGRHGLRAAGPLLAAGAVAVGATSVPGPGTPWQTWGLGARGRTVNPWRADRTPGGSSAGAAAAVAAGLVPLATGGDGAGSVRIPAAWCGVVGLKTTAGRLPSADRTGLAVPGVLARSAADAASWWQVVACEPEPGLPSLPVTAVWSPDLGFAGPDPEPVTLGRAAVERLVAAGVLRLVRPRVPVRLMDPGPAWLALRTPGAGSAGAEPGGTDLAGAHRVRDENDRRLAALFAEAELLLTPTAPTAPHGHEGPGDRYSTSLTWAFNLSGHPALSLPAGFGSDGCPAGLQLVAPHGREALLLAVAREAEARIGGWRAPLADLNARAYDAYAFNRRTPFFWGTP
ncbi:amidase [Streptomyces sp. FXY-T5]|uniref:amidase n=1 Tax=Streptomyces sp. FXY-T5 TaxID=3064901 RepID=UPI0027D33DB5|nr:amidase [Streptomyces sp. FXY-T5]WMD03503.1 amidase [Streptomyces sp. FXY-T5]